MSKDEYLEEKLNECRILNKSGHVNILSEV